MAFGNFDFGDIFSGISDFAGDVVGDIGDFFGGIGDSFDGGVSPDADFGGGLDISGGQDFGGGFGNQFNDPFSGSFNDPTSSFNTPGFDDGPGFDIPQQQLGQPGPAAPNQTDPVQLQRQLEEWVTRLGFFPGGNNVSGITTGTGGVGNGSILSQLFSNQGGGVTPGVINTSPIGQSSQQQSVPGISGNLNQPFNNSLQQFFGGLF